MSRKFQQNRQYGRSHQFCVEIIIPRGRGNKKANGLNKTDYKTFDVMRRMKQSIDRYVKMVNGEARLYSEDVLIK